MVLSFALAGMQIEGETIISDAQMVAKSFETFIPDMIQAGANFELVELEGHDKH
jgi:5-enolpyruvylshikimate-3-phosphate synthase